MWQESNVDEKQPSLPCHSMTMGAPRALMGLCRGPTLDTQLLKAAVAAEQGLPLHNSVGLTALHCLCENEAVTAAALEAVLPCGPRDLALARRRERQDEVRRRHEIAAAATKEAERNSKEKANSRARELRQQALLTEQMHEREVNAHLDTLKK